MTSVNTKSGRGGARGGAGRPAFVPTEAQREIVYNLAKIGMRDADIASSIRDLDGEQISSRTLKKYFQNEINNGRNETVKILLSVLVELGKAGNIKAISLWLNNNYWTPKLKVEHAGIDGAQINVNLASLKNGELDELEQVLMRASALMDGDGDDNDAHDGI